MSSNKKILTWLFGILTGLGLIYFLFFHQPKPAEHKAIKLVLKQVEENKLNLTTVQLKDIFPSKENKGPYLEKYYSIKIVNKNNKPIFETKAPKQSIISRFVYPGGNQNPIIVKPNEEVSLYLPVYENADKAVVTDENGNTLISINLKTIN